MRDISTILTVLLLSASARAQVKLPPTVEPEVYRINQSAISDSRPVSFSIGYPKDWRAWEAGPPQVGELLTVDDDPVCSFSPKPSPPFNFSPLDPSQIIIWRSSRATAKAEAENFAASVRQGSKLYTQRDLAPIKTEAGDSGYLVVFEANFEKSREILSDFFFEVGAKGAIRISIVTRAEDSDLREKLQNLVLQTLRF